MFLHYYLFDGRTTFQNIYYTKFSTLKMNFINHTLKITVLLPYNWVYRANSQNLNSFFLSSQKVDCANYSFGFLWSVFHSTHNVRCNVSIQIWQSTVYEDEIFQYCFQCTTWVDITKFQRQSILCKFARVSPPKTLFRYDIHLMIYRDVFAICFSSLIILKLCVTSSVSFCWLFFIYSVIEEVEKFVVCKPQQKHCSS